MEKEKILQEALKLLNSFANEQMCSSSSEPVFSIKSSDSAGNSVLTINHGEINNDYGIFVQPWAPQKDINALIAQIKSISPKTILFADFVNPVMAEKFRRRSISFVDCVGNLFIKDKSLNFFVKGKKPSNLRSKRVRGRAFNTAGLKLIFAIFNQPKLLHATYRDISNEVNIALGSVGPVMDDLYASGYILDDGQRRLVNKNRLFERWVDGYLEKLRPKQILSCYTAEDENWWKNADPAEFEGVWGGETVIAKSTPFMIPETISLYFSSDEKTGDFSKYYGLRKDDEGDICLYKTFWSDQAGGFDAISPMIMYADIVDSINPGNWDVAKTFYGEAVAHLLSD
ncbi:MAG: hypothetical protein KAJ32_03420 [Gammaproteobacteria bacterium]|nr:hypothetical protein [Gammaproteobacteria bacterium]